MTNQITERGEWATLSVHPSFPWPEIREVVTFRGYGVWILPPENGTYPMVAIDCSQHKLSVQEGQRLLLQLMSAVVWMERKGVSILSHGHSPYAIRQRVASDVRFTKSVHPVHFDELPEPSDRRAQLALPLHREAIETPNTAFRFLGMFKIINVLHKSGPQQIFWINDAVSRLPKQVGKRVDEIKEKEENVGSYLYRSGRCAVAHAYSEPLVDPDQPDDLVRLAKDVELITELARSLIEIDLGVKSAQTVCRLHEYELRGFKCLLGWDYVEQVLREKSFPPDISVPSFPELAVRIRDRERLPELERLSVAELGLDDDAVVWLSCESFNARLKIFLGLDFANERLRFNPHTGISMKDDGSVRAARLSARVN